MSDLRGRQREFGESAALGFDAEKLRCAASVVERGVTNGVTPCAVYAVLRHGKLAAQGAYGIAQPHSIPGVPAALDTIFDAASLTKTFTAVLLLQCAEAGELHLGLKVLDFLPEADGSPIGGVTLRQLATHTSGLPPWTALYKTQHRSALAHILAAPLTAAPGTAYAYSDLGYILLGEIVSRVAGKPFDVLAAERLFAPCEMENTGYRPAAALRPRIAATACCPMREGRILVGEVHDANAHSLAGVAGHAGVFSDVTDLARFAVALMSGRLLSPLTLRLAAESQIPAAVGGHSIGFFTAVNGMLPKGDLLSDRAFGHTGFTGTMLLFDPACDLVIILLTNRVYYAADGTGISRLRRTFANAVAGAVI